MIKNSRRVGILTGGGDCPGLNAAIRAVVRAATPMGWSVIGFRDGWRGVLEGLTMPFPLDQVDALLSQGGTILGSSRTNPFQTKEGPAQIKKTMKDQSVEALIVIGGEDTLGVATKLHGEGISLVGIPKTIDNDVGQTEASIGFASAVQIVCESLDRIQTTAQSHKRVMVVEVMGRHAGWLAALGGIAGGADFILVPESPSHLSDLLRSLEETRKRGKFHAIVVVAEGSTVIDLNDQEVTEQSEAAVDAFGHVRLGGIGERLARMIGAALSLEVRWTSLGHVQRGGAPIALDRILATALGVRAMQMVAKGRYGYMASLQEGCIQEIELKKATETLHTLSPEWFELGKIFFG